MTSQKTLASSDKGYAKKHPCSPPSSSEENDEDFRQGIDHLLKGYSTKAKDFFKKSYHTRIQKFGKDHIAVSIAQEKIADAAAAAGEDDEARKAYEELLHNLQTDDWNENKQTSKVALRILVKTGDFHYKVNNYALANKFYKEALPKIKKDFGDNHADVVHVVKFSIRASTKRGKNAAENKAFDKALMHFDEAMSLILPYMRKEEEGGIHLEKRDDFELMYLKLLKSVGDLHVQMENHDAALKIFSDVWTNIVVETPKILHRGKRTWKELGMILHNMGILYENLCQFDKAMDHYQTSLSVKRKVLDENDEKVIKTINCIGFVHFIRGEDDEALHFFKKVMHYMREHATIDNFQVYSSTMKDMAIIYIRRNEYDHAALCLEGKIKLLEKCLGPQNSEIAETYHQSGCLYFQCGRYDKALKCHQKALRVKKLLWKNDNEYIALTLRHMGACQSAAGRYEEALVCYRDSLSSSGDLERAFVLNRMGMIFSKKCDLQKALECYEQALKIQSLSEGEQIDVLILLLNNMGNVYYSGGIDNKAVECYQKAFDLGSKAQEPNDENSIGALYNLGILHLMRKSYVEAEQSFIKTIKPHKLSFSNEIKEAKSTALNNIGNVYSKQGDHVKAVEHYKKSLELKEEILDGKSDAILGTSSNLGSSYFHMGQYENALNWFERALKMMEEKKMPAENENNDLKIATLLDKIGNVYFKRKEFDSAMKHYHKALQLKKNVLGDDNHKEILMTRHDIGLVLCKQGRFDEAKNLFDDVYFRKRDVLGNGHPEVAKLLLDMASMHLARKEYKKTKTLCESALSLFKKANLPQKHSYMRQVGYTMKKLDMAQKHKT